MKALLEQAGQLMTDLMISCNKETNTDRIARHRTVYAKAERRYRRRYLKAMFR